MKAVSLLLATSALLGLSHLSHERQEALDFAWSDDAPVHGKSGWELARYEWNGGVGTFHYVRNTGERRTVARTQPKYVVGGVK